MELLDAGLRSRLTRFRLAASRTLGGTLAGERRSRARGQSAQIAGHREYQPGDDPRALDWNAFARLDRLFVKVFDAEAELSVHLFVDASASMSFGAPPKLELARRLAAAFAFVALNGSDRVGLAVLGGSGRALRPSRGPSWLPRILAELEQLAPAGRFDPAEALKLFASSRQRPGLAVVISDFLDPRGRDGIAALLAARHEVWCLQVLCAEDRGEALEGDLGLVDSETDDLCEVTLDSETLTAYRAAVDSFCGGLRRFCSERGARWRLLDCAADVESSAAPFLKLRT